MHIHTTKGGPHLFLLEVSEFKAFLGMHILMELKRNPSMRSFWSKEQFLYCPLISWTMPRARFESIMRYFHLTKNTKEILDKNHLIMTKVYKDMCQSQWNLHKWVMVDKMMVCYKGYVYCHVWQYMPSKHIKWGLKIRALVDFETRLIYNFDIYCGKN